MNGKAVWKYLVLAFLLGIACGLQAQLQTTTYNKPATFEDVSDKFIRNMKLLQPLVQDTEIKQRMGSVIGQAQDLRTIYGSKNAGKRREQIMEQLEDMVLSSDLKDSDQKKLAKLQEELRGLDPDNNFNKGREQVQKTMGELRELLGRVYISDASQKDILRLVQDHLTFYGNAMGKLR